MRLSIKTTGRDTVARTRPMLSAVGILVAIGLFVALTSGCGAQNEYLAEGKDLLKSDKRRKVELAVEQFRQALKIPLSQRDKAETQYLLGYYDESLPVEERARLFVEACDLHPRKYEDALLYETLRDRDETVRQAVRMALTERYEKDPARIRKNLVKAIRGKDNRDRYDAAWVMGHLAAKDDALLDELLRDLSHRQMQTRLNAVIALEELAKENPERARQKTVSALLEKIEAVPRRKWWKPWEPEGERESPEVRTQAVSVLGKMGATEELLGILRNKGSSLRANAMNALTETGKSETAVNVLLGLLDEGTTQTTPWQTSQSIGRRMVSLK